VNNKKQQIQLNQAYNAQKDDDSKYLKYVGRQIPRQNKLKHRRQQDNNKRTTICN